MNKSKLKFCPLCNGKSRFKSGTYNTYGAYGTDKDKHTWWAVYCTSCGISQPKRKYFSKDEAIKNWNIREGESNE